MSTDPKSSEVPIQSIPTSERISTLNDVYMQEFGSKPSFFVRVPGRVNIIGEHIDYCGYPVLPMALEQDIHVAAGLLDEPQLCIRNVNKKYENFDVKINTFEELQIENDGNEKPYWHNYVLCGVKGALEYLKNKKISGLQLLFDGNILPASGLSSSSALVSAACLAFLYAQKATLNKTEIASLCANSERYIGTQGGGMDQAIAFLAERYKAQYITWQPLNATPVALPEDVSFVVAHCLAEANKAATNDFNQRVMECRLAAKLLLTVSNTAKRDKIITLSEVQKTLQYNLEQMVELVHKQLTKDIYTKAEICNLLDVSEKELDSLYLSPNTRHLKEFKLKQRALHVYEEALRVENFRKVCLEVIQDEIRLSNGTNGSADNCYENGNGNKQETLGKLMSASHESLKNLYECSHQNLDCLVDLSKKMGVHSRLTGAGWGGCIVALCPKDKAEDYIEMLKEEFYYKQCNIDKNKASHYVFATSPNHGAIIFK